MRIRQADRAAWLGVVGCASAKPTEPPGWGVGCASAETPGWVSDAHPPSRQSRLAASRMHIRQADAPAWMEPTDSLGWNLKPTRLPGWGLRADRSAWLELLSRQAETGWVTECIAMSEQVRRL